MTIKNFKTKAALFSAALGLFSLSVSLPSAAGLMPDATAGESPISKYLSVCQAAVSKAPSWSEATKILKSYEDRGFTSLSDFCSFYVMGRLDQYEIEKEWKTPVSANPIVPYSKQPRLKDPNEAWRT